MGVSGENFIQFNFFSMRDPELYKDISSLVKQFLILFLLNSLIKTADYFRANFLRLSRPAITSPNGSATEPPQGSDLLMPLCGCSCCGAMVG